MTRLEAMLGVGQPTDTSGTSPNCCRAGGKTESQAVDDALVLHRFRSNECGSG